jgi:hypothetical protein
MNTELVTGVEVFQTINNYWRLGIRLQPVTCFLLCHELTLSAGEIIKIRFRFHVALQ